MLLARAEGHCETSAVPAFRRRALSRNRESRPQSAVNEHPPRYLAAGSSQCLSEGGVVGRVAGVDCLPSLTAQSMKVAGSDHVGVVLSRAFAWMRASLTDGAFCWVGGSFNAP